MKQTPTLSNEPGAVQLLPARGSQRCQLSRGVGWPSTELHGQPDSPNRQKSNDPETAGAVC
jgi:hypothetical protein